MWIYITTFDTSTSDFLVFFTLFASFSLLFTRHSMKEKTKTLNNGLGCKCLVKFFSTLILDFRYFSSRSRGTEGRLCSVACSVYSFCRGSSSHAGIYSSTAHTDLFC